MTIVAWDGSVLAADRQMTWADMRSTACKIRQLPNGEAIAATGDSAKAMEVMRWYEQGADPEKWPKCQIPEDYARLIVARRTGVLIYFDWLPIEMPIIDTFMAFGAGRDFAVGAMAMGADAVEAVEVASKYSALCGLGVDSFVVPQ